VHAVPVEDGTGGFAGDGEGHGADSVVGVAAVFEDADYGLRSQYLLISGAYGVNWGKKGAEVAVRCALDEKKT
jgi:hypothetical protein